MLFFRKKKPYIQTSPEEWRRSWEELFPPECRHVPVTIGEKTYDAFVLVGHNAMMLQDGLLMEAEFFDVCEHFQDAGYHVIWLMRCTQDIYNGYLKRKSVSENGAKMTWDWKSPTTNFGRWSTDNQHISIILQIEELPEEGPEGCTKKILQRVTWTESDDPERMIPRRTMIYTVNVPDTPPELVRWLNGESLSKFQD